MTPVLSVYSRADRISWAGRERQGKPAAEFPAECRSETPAGPDPATADTRIDLNDRMTSLCRLKYLLLLALAVSISVSTADIQPKRILFVCEHGSVKSIVAVAHFNRLAAEAGLDYCAISRGTKPDNEVPAVVLEGLRKDGLAPSLTKPVKLDTAEARGVARIVAMCELPDEYSSDKRVTKWTDVPPVTVDYGKARDVLVRHLRVLIAELNAK